MKTLEKLEALAVERLGRGAAISIDKCKTGGTDVVVWDPKGTKRVVSCFAPHTRDAVRAALNALREM